MAILQFLHFRARSPCESVFELTASVPRPERAPLAGRAKTDAW